MVYSKKVKSRPKSRRIAKLRAPIHYRCNICMTYFNSVYMLNKHKFTHRSYIWDCELCNIAFPTERLLILHYKVHSNNLKYVCQYSRYYIYLKFHC